jgi:putative transposase
VPNAQHSLEQENRRLKRENEILRQEREILKLATKFFAFILQHAAQFQIKILTRVLQVSLSGYYAWLKRLEKPSPRAEENAALLEDIRVVHTASRALYGSPRVHAALRRNGTRVSRYRVARLMRSAGLQGKAHRRKRVKTTNSTHDPNSTHDQPRAPHHLERKFDASSTNLIWVSDITYLDTTQGWLFLCVVLDVCSRRIVGWAFSSSLETGFVVRALQMAVQTRKPSKSLMFHSDQGVQYSAVEFRQALSRLEAVQSMSRKGDCWDNAPCESFFATLKLELDLGKARGDQRETEALVFEWMEVFYHRQRLHSSLGFVSPAEFELAQAT